MAKRKIEAIIEKSDTGFGIYAKGLPGITGFGKTIAEAKKDIKSALQETIQAYGDVVPEDLKGSIELVYRFS